MEKDVIEQSFMIRIKLKKEKGKKSLGAAVVKNHIKIWNVILLQRLVLLAIWCFAVNIVFLNTVFCKIVCECAIIGEVLLFPVHLHD